MKQVIFICRLGGISNLLSDDPRLGIRRSVCKCVQITAEIYTLKAVMICGFFFQNNFNIRGRILLYRRFCDCFT